LIPPLWPAAAISARRLLDRGRGVDLVAEPLRQLVLGGANSENGLDEAADHHRATSLTDVDQHGLSMTRSGRRRTRGSSNGFFWC